MTNTGYPCRLLFWIPHYHRMLLVLTYTLAHYLYISVTLYSIQHLHTWNRADIMCVPRITFCGLLC